MSTTLDRPPRRAGPTPAERLRTTMAAARVSFTWFGTRKTLSAEQKAQAADAFGAEGQFLSAGKKLFDTRHPKFMAVTAVRHRAVFYWRALTLPYPEPGLRLIRRDQIDAFQSQMERYREELLHAVEDLDEHFDSLKSAARDRLGQLFNPADYPVSLSGAFEIAWDFPSIEPPDYLKDLNPDIYEEECQRIRSRFDEAIRLAEEAFQEELASLVSHLRERLGGAQDGKPKIFRDSAIGNLREFFERFQSLNVRSNEQLDDLVAQCQEILQGVEPRQLRDSQPLRQRIASELESVETVLEGLLVDRPRRRILRESKGGD